MRTHLTRPDRKSIATLTLVPRPGPMLKSVPPGREERPGLERWILLLHREEGLEPRRARERSSMHVALRDLAW